jgi:tetratricopeptide (TPR) repeat protein
MSAKVFRNILRALTCVALCTTTMQLARAEPAENAAEVHTLSTKAAKRELFDRDVDKVALSSQDSAIAKLNSLARRYAGTHQEPILLAKLAELQQQKSGILFRIAHGAASRKVTPKAANGKKGAPVSVAVNLTAYRKALEDSVATLDLLIAKYPAFEEVAHAYYTRGKAYEEMEKKTEATKDYALLVKHFPEAEESSPAYMSLAEFAIEANNHPLAITYLKEIEKRPEDTHYPFALYKLAWSYYNLKNIPTALAYAEKQLAWYAAHAPAGDAIKEPGATSISSDDAIRENTLLDVPVFYFQSVEDKDDRYQTSKALAYFRKLESGPLLGRMALRFSKLLRSRDMEAELIAWKNQFITEEPKRPENLDIILITYEFLQNRRDFAKVEQSAQDIVKLYLGGTKFENLGKAQKMILDTAETLQALIVKNKQTEEALPLSKTLARMYASFTQIVDQKDPRVPQIHYNLAETLFAIKDYEGATEHYRWVAKYTETNKKTKINAEVQHSVADAGIKAIAARYEVLHAKNLIATEMKATALPVDKDKKSDNVAMDPLVTDWISWIDTEMEQRESHKDVAHGDAKEFDNFQFEANRCLYARGHTRDAVKRLEQFAQKHPASDYAVPSASLVIDTYLASQDWDKSFELAHTFMAVKEWKNNPFTKRLFEVSADSFFKKIEAHYALANQGAAAYRANICSETLADIDRLLKEYGSSARVADALNLAGAAALASGEKERAIGYFGRLIDASKGDGKNPGRAGDALLARAAIEEDQYLFAAAAEDYRTFLSLGDGTNAGTVKFDASKLDKLRRKTVVLTYLSGDPRQLKDTLAAKTVCNSALEDECGKYEVLAAIEHDVAIGQGPNFDETERAFNHFRKMDNSQTKTLWAIYTLLSAKHLAFRDRNLALRVVGEGYANLDPLSKFSLVPIISSEVPNAFRLNRIGMKSAAPLKANEKYITHRVDLIREMENAATQAMQLPWARIRAEILNETASLYLDLSQGLEALPAPKGMSQDEAASYSETIRHLSVPFEEKGQDIRAKAFEIASSAGIEDEAFQAIADPFFAENPSQAKKLRATAAAETPNEVSMATLTSFPLGLAYTPGFENAVTAERDELLRKTPDVTTRDALRKQHAIASRLYSAWLRATQDKKWPQVAFFLQEAREQKLFEAGDLSVLKAISLTQAGARGEGLSELEEGRKDLSPTMKKFATLTLARQFSHTFSTAKSRSLFCEIQPHIVAPVVAVAVAKPPTPPTKTDRKPAGQ